MGSQENSTKKQEIYVLKISARYRKDRKGSAKALFFGAIPN